MKVLHLPHNVASQIDTHVRMLKAAGVDARGLVWDNAPHYSVTPHVEHYSPEHERFRPLRRRLRKLAWYGAVLKAIRWADIVHWRFGYRGVESLPWDLDLRCAAATRKPCLIDFCGTDIRIPTIAGQDNGIVSRAYELSEMPDGSSEQSLRTQALFSRYGFRCILRRHELIPYLDRKLFPTFYMTCTPVIMTDFPEAYPDPAKRKPHIIHCPTRLGAKGTQMIREVIQRLARVQEFEFSVIQNVSRAECLNAMRHADIVIDQVVIGDYGNVALEAMAFGKPTLCYLKPSVSQALPAECPLINASPESLYDILDRLVTDGSERHAIGRRSRAYVEQHHGSVAVADRLLGIYEELLASSPPKSVATSFGHGV